MNTNKPPAVIIIVVNWNNYSDTRACIHSLGNIAYPNLKIILIDNGSENNSSERIAEEFPDIILLQQLTNRGFAAGVNAGLRHAMELGGDYFLLLNNDTKVISQSFLQVLVERMTSQTRLGAIGPLIRLMDGSIQRTIGYFPTVRNSIIHGFFQIPVFSQHEPCNPESLSGVCLLLRKQAVIDAGPLDENFFLYVEEHEWLYRIQEKGWQLEYQPIESIRHHHGLSTRQISEKAYILQKSNVVYFLVKHSYHVQALITACLFLLLHPFRAFVERAIRRNDTFPDLGNVFIDIKRKWKLGNQMSENPLDSWSRF